jgi:hypothetical protein
MDNQVQNFKNHARFVTAYHFVAGPIFIINAIWALYSLTGGLTVDAVRDALVAIALVILFLFARVFALKAQDRVIRLEMQLRMREILPDDLHSRINDFSVPQMIGLRFAGDSELPTLARKVLDENLTNVTEIKKLIADWRGDYDRV